MASEGLATATALVAGRGLREKGNRNAAPARQVLPVPVTPRLWTTAA